MASSSSQPVLSQSTIIHDIATSIVSAEGFVLCIKCGERLFRRISGSDRNPGRVYWKCDICGTFMWDDQLPPHRDEDLSTLQLATRSSRSSPSKPRSTTPRGSPPPPPPYSIIGPLDPGSPLYHHQSHSPHVVASPETPQHTPARRGLKRERSPSSPTCHRRLLPKADRLPFFRAVAEGAPISTCTPINDAQSAAMPSSTGHILRSHTISPQARTRQGLSRTTALSFETLLPSASASQTGRDNDLLISQKLVNTGHAEHVNSAQTEAANGIRAEHSPPLFSSSSQARRSRSTSKESTGGALDLSPSEDNTDVPATTISQVHNYDHSFDLQRIFADMERLPIHVRNLEREIARLRTELKRERASRAQLERALRCLLGPASS